MATRSSKKSRAKASPKDNTPRAAEGEHQTGPVAGTALVAGATFGLKGLLYADVDGLALFEGDIILGTVEEVQANADAASSDMLPQAAVVISAAAAGGFAGRTPPSLSKSTRARRILNASTTPSHTGTPTRASASSHALPRTRRSSRTSCVSWRAASALRWWVAGAGGRTSR